MFPIPDEIVTAMCQNGLSLNECCNVCDQYIQTNIEKVELLHDLDPLQLEETAICTTSKRERSEAIRLLGVFLMLIEGFAEENMSGIIELPSNVCLKLLNKVAENDTYAVLEDDIKDELKKRICKIDRGVNDIHREAMVVQYSRMYSILKRNEHAAIALALLKQHVPIYVVYSIVRGLNEPKVALSRGLFHKICKLC